MGESREQRTDTITSGNGWFDENGAHEGEPPDLRGRSAYVTLNLTWFIVVCFVCFVAGMVLLAFADRQVEKQTATAFDCPLCDDSKPSAEEPLYVHAECVEKLQEQQLELARETARIRWEARCRSGTSPSEPLLSSKPFGHSLPANRPRTGWSKGSHRKPYGSNAREPTG